MGSVSIGIPMESAMDVQFSGMNSKHSYVLAAGYD
jgi:hypothetical protein